MNRIDTNNISYSGIFYSTVHFGDHKKVNDLGLTSYTRIAALVINIFKRLGLSEGTITIKTVNNATKKEGIVILSKEKFNKWKNSFFSPDESKIDSYFIRMSIGNRLLRSEKSCEIKNLNDKDPTDVVNILISAKNQIIEKTK